MSTIPPAPKHGFKPMKIIVPPDLAEKLGGLTQADMISAWGAVPALVRFENNEAFPIWSVDPKTEDR